MRVKKILRLMINNIIIGTGAEATVYKKGDKVIKQRPVKRYRHPALDKRIRKYRTRREAKVISSLSVNGPSLVSFDDNKCEIIMSFVSGVTVRDFISEDNSSYLCPLIGRLVRKLHDSGIVHGDLTTSNMIIDDGKLSIIDFGLSAFSNSIEEKAVDLYLLKQGLDTKHPDIVSAWDLIIKAYNPDDELLSRLRLVQQRGRYKRKRL